MKKVRVEPNGCWLWTGGRFVAGYGMFVLGGKQRRAHRVLYVWTHGDIPTNQVLDHLCRTSLCVNPAHLEPSTNRVNVVVRGTGSSAQNARKTHCPRGHPYDEANTYVFMQSGLPARMCRTCVADRARDKYRTRAGVDPSRYRLPNRVGQRHISEPLDISGRTALGRRRQGGGNPHAKLTEDDVRTMRRLVAEGMTQAAAARRFGVSSVQASLIVRGKSWAHVPLVPVTG